MTKELPDLTKQPLMFVDGTPDKEYPLRILRAYRELCNCKWRIDGTDPFFEAMNKICDDSAKILDDAIKVLEEYNNL